MSSSTSSPTDSATPSATSTLTNSGSNGGLSGGFQAGATSFYKNLFYILIAVLGIFACFSLLSWYRGRLRQRIIFAEARRLGLLVPGMPGYSNERDRLLLLQLSGISSASGRPEIWDVYRDGKEGGKKESKERAVYDPPSETLDAGMQPLSASPVPDPTIKPPPFPVSNLPLFPNNVAFLAPSADSQDREPATDWESQVRKNANDSGLDEVTRNRRNMIQISVLVRMPVEKVERDRPVDNDAAVQEEWEGTEVGLVEVPVWVSRS